MTHLPTSSFSAIFCLKLKDKVFVAVILLIRFVCTSAKEIFIEKKEIIKFEKEKLFFLSNLTYRISLLPI